MSRHPQKISRLRHHVREILPLWEVGEVTALKITRVTGDPAMFRLRKCWLRQIFDNGDTEMRGTGVGWRGDGRNE